MKSKRLAIARTVYPLDYNANDRRYDDAAFRRHIATEQLISRVKIQSLEVLERFADRMEGYIKEICK